MDIYSIYIGFKNIYYQLEKDPEDIETEDMLVMIDPFFITEKEFFDLDRQVGGSLSKRGLIGGGNLGYEDAPMDESDESDESDTNDNMEEDEECSEYENGTNEKEDCEDRQPLLKQRQLLQRQPHSSTNPTITEEPATTTQPPVAKVPPTQPKEAPTTEVQPPAPAIVQPQAVQTTEEPAKNEGEGAPVPELETDAVPAQLNPTNLASQAHADRVKQLKYNHNQRIKEIEESHKKKQTSINVLSNEDKQTAQKSLDSETAKKKANATQTLIKGTEISESMHTRNQHRIEDSKTSIYKAKASPEQPLGPLTEHNTIRQKRNEDIRQDHATELSKLNTNSSDYKKKQKAMQQSMNRKLQESRKQYAKNTGQTLQQVAYNNKQQKEKQIKKKHINEFNRLKNGLNPLHHKETQKKIEQSMSNELKESKSQYTKNSETTRLNKLKRTGRAITAAPGKALRST